MRFLKSKDRKQNQTLIFKFKIGCECDNFCTERRKTPDLDNYWDCVREMTKTASQKYRETTILSSKLTILFI